jgi:hypothetical protein
MAPDAPGEVERWRERLEATEAVLSIQAMKARYAELVDARFGPAGLVEHDTLVAVTTAAAALFTEDAVWDGGPTLGVAVGRSAIAERLQRSTLSYGRHLFLAPRIEVEGREATGRWELLSPCTTSDGRSWWLCGTEEDLYRQVDGAWLHARMRLTVHLMAPAPERFRPLS